MAHGHNPTFPPIGGRNTRCDDPIIAAVAERSRLSYAETADIIDGFMAALDRARTEQPQNGL